MDLILKKITRPKLLLGIATVGALIYAVVSVMPPRHIRIAAGPANGSFFATAQQYKKLIEQKGFYHVDVVPFDDTDEIAAKLADPHSGFDIGFVAEGPNVAGRSALMSLGEIQAQPIFIFENRRLAASRPIASFTDLRGLRLVMLPRRSVTSHRLMSIFEQSGVTERNTHIEFQSLGDAFRHLRQGQFDVGLFILAADNEAMATLAKDPDLAMVQVSQRAAMAKKFSYLREVQLPAGIYDFAANVPDHDIGMLAATIIVGARRDLRPATSYAVLEAMREVHGQGGYLNAPGEFPRYSGSPDRVEDRVVDFYRNGVPWTYSHLPIELASIIDAYLTPLLTLWFMTSVPRAMSEIERMREFVLILCARGALWRMRRSAKQGLALSSWERAFIERIEAGMTRQGRGLHALLAELRDER
ncbi:TAXI family TRAP transporter solute-binding subunit [Trinickia fusca]|uniref:C4-dicarboxylate ABC transporter substrate-binding protein n=1 Tax=Trinickia fusca TaxID=2419777 RepID=A0A494XXC6_9BURK|nr:TAXI family TRAP transporter solute-binding subunit [Trinickia fusca]RKP52243.1 hypothetical protein D7S89_01515 [Trinickia fusca]